MVKSGCSQHKICNISNTGQNKVIVTTDCTCINFW